MIFLPHMWEKNPQPILNPPVLQNVDCRHVPMSVPRSLHRRSYRSVLHNKVFFSLKISANICYVGEHAFFFMQRITFAQLNMPRSYVLNGEGLTPIPLLLYSCLTLPTLCLKISYCLASPETTPAPGKTTFHQVFMQV